MKKSILFLIIAISCAMQSFAYDFPIIAPSGQVIYLNIVDSENHTACVTYPNLLSGSYYFGYDKPTGDLVIPETINSSGNVTWTIVSIGNHAFDNCAELTSVELPNTVTTIGEYAFYQCSGIVSVDLPNNLTTLGNHTFEQCSELISIEIPNTITVIEDYVFNQCSGLTSIEIPNSVTMVGEKAFCGCNHASEIEIPESVTNISSSAFSGCSEWTGCLNISASVVSIDLSAFSGCSKLQGLSLPNKHIEYGPGCFSNCGFEGQLVLPDSLTIIASSMFSGCAYITDIVFPNTLTTIYSSAFSDCNSITNIHLPNSIITIYENPFWGCKNLTEITIDENNENYYSENNAIIRSETKKLVTGCKTTVIPNDIECIGYKSFARIGEGLFPTIPNSVTNIEYGAFTSCEFTGTCVIPNSVTLIDSYAFEGCSFDELIISDSLTEIPYSCFSECRNLKKLEIPKAIQRIGQDAFFRCSSLSSIYCYAQQPPVIQTSNYDLTFYGVSKSIPVYVPIGCAEAYRNAPSWEDFRNFIEMPEFAPTHAEWYYEIVNDNGSITYQQLQQEGDTVINHKDVKIIVRTNTLYDKHQEITHEYIYEENNVVYWWNKTLDEFTTLYDFAAETGDEWQIKVGTETITLHVDAVELVEYDGRTYKVLKVSDEGDLFSGNIVCGIGHVASFFPEKLMQKALPFDVESLRCYWVNDNLILHMGTVDCDEILAVEENVSAQDSESITLYPNPTNGTLYIESQGDACTFSISNMLGQTVMTGNIADNQIIDVSRLDDGMYFICIGQRTVKFAVRK